jgi:hypothetical protein
MTDDFTTPPAEPGTASKIVDGIQVASSVVSDAIETGQMQGASRVTFMGTTKDIASPNASSMQNV